MVPLDTSPEAHQAQIEAYRRLGEAGRLATVFRLNETVRRLAMAGIRSRHPDYSDQQLKLAYARLTLRDDDLVRKVWPDHELVEP